MKKVGIAAMVLMAIASGASAGITVAWKNDYDEQYDKCYEDKEWKECTHLLTRKETWKNIGESFKDFGDEIKGWFSHDWNKDPSTLSIGIEWKTPYEGSQWEIYQNVTAANIGLSRYDCWEAEDLLHKEEGLSDYLKNVSSWNSFKKKGEEDKYGYRQSVWDFNQGELIVKSRCDFNN